MLSLYRGERGEGGSAKSFIPLLLLEGCALPPSRDGLFFASGGIFFSVCLPYYFAWVSSERAFAAVESRLLKKFSLRCCIILLVIVDRRDPTVSRER